MKRLLVTLMLACAVAASGCWEGGPGGGSLIVTPEVEIRLHGHPAMDAQNALTVALPAQLDIRVVSVIDQMTLQIRSGTSGNWTTVRTVSGPVCALSTIFRPIFGRDTFTLALVGAGTTWQFRVHVVSGVYQNFALSEADSGAYTLYTSSNRRPVWVD